MQRTSYDPDAYQRGRGLAPATVQLWLEQLGQHCSAPTAHRVVDLGCGTGRFTAPLAEFYTNSFVIGMEPSLNMLAAAARDNPHERTAYVSGIGEAIPLCDASCDLVFMSMVLHHLEDQPAALMELSRISRERGFVFIRSAFRERLEDVPWYEYFPTAKTVDQERLPSKDATIELFSGHFQCASVEIVHQVFARDLNEYADRLSLRQISTLKLIPDSEFHHGLASMREAATKTPSQPVLEPVDLLVFCKA